jgi:hypothetical protein
MPSNNAYTQQNPDNIDVLDSQHFDYGTTPKQAVAEQNQTYFAYFDGVGGTGPELIDQTAYFIKYLIDTEGNVVNPEPDTNPSRPQAIALHNLTDNFEIGKKAIVKLIGNDPLLTANPNDDSLIGKHDITHVGRIVPILVTETGVNDQDYITTMSFGSLSSQTTNPVGNVGARMFYQNNTSGYITVSSSNWLDFPFNAHNNLGAGAWTQPGLGPSLVAQSSSIEARTRIKINTSLYIQNNPSMTGNNQIQTRIIKNSTETIWTSPWHIVTPTADGYWRPDGSSYIDFTATDEFKLQYRAYLEDTDENIYNFRVRGLKTSLGYVSDTSFTIVQETPTSPGGTTNAELIDGVNAIYAASSSTPPNSYFGILDAPTYNYSQLIFFSASRFIYDSGLTQNLNSASSTFGFSPISIPFGDVRPGDFIRLEYNKEQVYTIVDITKDFPFGGVPLPNTLALKVTPNVGSTLGANTSIQTPGHFIIYRVINDGSYVVLDVPKPTEGNSFTGIIQPEFISKELVNNTDKILADLTQKDLFN